jgi:hypothetical protein
LETIYQDHSRPSSASQSKWSFKGKTADAALHPRHVPLQNSLPLRTLNRISNFDTNKPDCLQYNFLTREWNSDISLPNTHIRSVRSYSQQLDSLQSFSLRRTLCTLWGRPTCIREVKIQIEGGLRRAKVLVEVSRGFLELGIRTFFLHEHRDRLISEHSERGGKRNVIM